MGGGEVPLFQYPAINPSSHAAPGICPAAGLSPPAHNDDHSRFKCELLVGTLNGVASASKPGLRRGSKVGPVAAAGSSAGGWRRPAAQSLLSACSPGLRRHGRPLSMARSMTSPR